MLSFEDIQKKYGEVIAYSILMDIERHLRLSPTYLATVEPGERFRRAIARMEGRPLCACGKDVVE